MAVQVHLTEIIVAFFGFLGVLVTAVFGWLKWGVQKKQTSRAEAELRFQAGAFDFSAFLQEWDGVHHDLKALMSETEIDRFLILR